MSTALAISGVTAVLQYFLNTVCNAPTSPLGGVSVTALAPDLVQSTGNGNNAKPQVNLFLHQVTPNAAWRNVALPSVGPDGSTRLGNPPLALDLHYLLTAYASEDTQAEALLGFGILMLHDNPVIPRDQVNFALTHLPTTNPLHTVLSASGLADQIEMLKVTPAKMGREEMAWVWTALKSDYRPTFAFDVSVVLMQSPLTSSLSLPVLSQNIAVQVGPTAPTVQVVLPGNEPAAVPGDTITVTGQFVTGTTKVLLANQLLRTNLTVTPTTAAATSISFPLPANTPAGSYVLSVTVTNGSGVVLQSTAPVSLSLAPTITSPATATAVANASGTLVTITCSPQAAPGQAAYLALGSAQAPSAAITAATSTLSFQFPTLAHGSYLARLTVDGVTSPIAINFTAKPPQFTGPFITV